MIWIELIGPSGIGKSYWYEQFMRKHPEYEPKQMVLNRIYHSKDFVNLPLKFKVMFWIQRMNIYRISNHFKYKLFSYFLKKFQRKSKSIYMDKDDSVIKNYLKSIDSLNEPQIVVLKKICYFHQQLIELKFYQFYLKENDIYIAEDGLMHLSPIFISELEPDKIFIFQKEYQRLVEQRLSRATTKPTAFIEFLLNEENLKEYIHNYYQLYATKIRMITERISSENVKTLDLDQVEVLKEMYQWVIACKSNVAV